MLRLLDTDFIDIGMIHYSDALSDIFEKENTENTYISWEDKMKPRIDLDDGITQEEYQALAARWEEMLSLAEEIIWQNYLNPE